MKGNLMEETPFSFVPYQGTQYEPAEMLKRSETYYQWMNQRRSLREFSDRPVPLAVIENIVMTASTAPSGAHKQPWTFAIVADPTIKAKIRPAIFITSNAKRELSDPFLRRCYCHHIAFPSRDDMKQIVNLHYPQTSPKLLEAAINIFYELRERGFEKPPATSELLDWIGALEATGQVPTREMPPLTGALLKRAGDILRYRGGSAGKARGSNY